MFDLSVYLWGLAALGVLAAGGWLGSLWLRRVDIVDSLWSLMFLLAGLVYTAVIVAAELDTSPSPSAEGPGPAAPAAVPLPSAARLPASGGPRAHGAQV